MRVILLASFALAIASAPALATTTTPSHAATHAVPPKPPATARKVTAAQRATPAIPAKPVRTAVAAKPRGKSGFVTTRLANGKKVTFDCHLAGNKTKAVCKSVS